MLRIILCGFSHTKYEIIDNWVPCVGLGLDILGILAKKNSELALLLFILGLVIILMHAKLNFSHFLYALFLY